MGGNKRFGDDSTEFEFIHLTEVNKQVSQPVSNEKKNCIHVFIFNLIVFFRIHKTAHKRNDFSTIGTEMEKKNRQLQHIAVQNRNTICNTYVCAYMEQYKVNHATFVYFCWYCIAKWAEAGSKIRVLLYRVESTMSSMSELFWMRTFQNLDVLYLDNIFDKLIKLTAPKAEKIICQLKKAVEHFNTTFRWNRHSFNTTSRSEKYIGSFTFQR